MQVKASKTRNWDKSLLKETPFFLRNTAVDLPAFNIALVNVLAKQKKRLPLDYNEILF